MAFQLTIKERYDLMHNIARMPCTVALRFAVDEFNSIVDFTEQELREKAITIDKTTYDITSNDDSYEITVDSLPQGVVSAIKVFIKMYDTDDMKTNAMVQDTLKLYKKVI